MSDTELERLSTVCYNYTHWSGNHIQMITFSYHVWLY
jgi:hypothetical protein